MAAEFEVYRNGSGGFRFRLRASNGHIIATGEGSRTKRSALDGIEPMKRNAATAEVEDHTGVGGRHRDLEV